MLHRMDRVNEIQHAVEIVNEELIAFIVNGARMEDHTIPDEGLEVDFMPDAEGKVGAAIMWSVGEKDGKA